MPSQLEYVVRPSQAPQIRPGAPTQIFKAPKVPENTPVVWGSPGNSVFDLHAEEQANLPQPKWETSRTVDVVRVFNPNDKTQYIDTEQMTQYQGRSRLSNEKFTLNFSPGADTENTQVIQRGVQRISAA